MDYREFVRPKYIDLMRALGMECEFHRASGANLFYRNKTGSEVAVDDFLGGYGAALFGHNDPVMVQQLIDMLQRQVPFHAQLSVRKGAGELGRQLSEAVNREQNHNEKFVTTFSNSGAEAVEVAIKHAEFCRQRILREQFDEIDYRLAQIASKNGYSKVNAADLDLPIGVLPASLTEVTLIQVVEAIRQYNLRQFQLPPVFLAVKKCFHGKLVSTVQLTHGKQYREAFSRFGLNVEFIDPENYELQLTSFARRHASHCLSLEKNSEGLSIRKCTITRFAGVLLEPIQGEGGINQYATEFYLSVRRFCNEQQCPLIIDEVQSGFGRTGKLLASSHLGLRGDYYCLSKALGGGLVKIAATMIRASHYENDFSYLHSSTFAEDELACQIAMTALNRLLANNEKVLQEITSKGDYLLAALNKVRDEYPDVVKSVRGRGLLVGLELHELDRSASMVFCSTQYNEALGYMLAGYLLQQENIRVAPSASNANVIRLEPPVCVTHEQIDRLTHAMRRMCNMLRRQDAYPLAASVCADRIGKIPQREQMFGQSLIEEKQKTTDSNVPVVAKVAFINHLIDSEMLSDVDESLADMTLEEKELFIARMKPERRAAPIGPVIIRSAQGVAVEFTLYPLCMNSDAMAAYLASDNITEIRDEINDRIRDAREAGCTVAGLGMYTSIVTNNCQSIQIADVALTSGNALTIGMGLKAIEHGSITQRLMLSDETAVIIGAAGNIASTYASLLSERVNRLILLGSGKEGSLGRLEKTAFSIYTEAAAVIRSGEVQDDLLALRLSRLEGITDLLDKHGDSKHVGQKIYQHVHEMMGADAFIRVSNDLSEIRKARIVLCAANSPRAFLSAELFAENSVICDIAVPLNVDSQVASQRGDVLYLHGGIVKTPCGDGLFSNVRAYLKDDQLYACMAESVLMGLAGSREHYSYGDITRDQVRRILALAESHGFTLAQYKTQNSL